MPGVADQDQRAAGTDILAALHVHFGDQRAGCVEHVETARFRITFDGLSDTVRAENSNGALRHFIEFLDEARALLAQIVDHMTIVDNLVTDVHGGPVLL